MNPSFIYHVAVHANIGAILTGYGASLKMVDQISVDLVTANNCPTGIGKGWKSIIGGYAYNNVTNGNTGGVANSGCGCTVPSLGCGTGLPSNGGIGNSYGNGGYPVQSCAGTLNYVSGSGVVYDVLTLKAIIAAAIEPINNVALMQEGVGTYQAPMPLYTVNYSPSMENIAIDVFNRLNMILTNQLGLKVAAIEVCSGEDTVFLQFMV